MNRLKDFRVAAGFSQKYVAMTLGVKPPSVSNWENGKTVPTQDNLKALAMLYGVSVDALLGIDKPKRKKSVASEYDTVYSKLSAEEKEKAVQYMRFLLAQREK